MTAPVRQYLQNIGMIIQMLAVVDGHLTYYVHKDLSRWTLADDHPAGLHRKKGEPVKSWCFIGVCAYASIAVFDAFIACWGEKFKTNLVRPITVINQFVDRDWEPFYSNTSLSRIHRRPRRDIQCGGYHSYKVAGR